MAGRRSPLGATRNSGFNAITRALLSQLQRPPAEDDGQTQDPNMIVTPDGNAIYLDQGGVPLTHQPTAKSQEVLPYFLDPSARMRMLESAYNSIPADLRAGAHMDIVSPEQLQQESGGYYKGRAPMGVAANGDYNTHTAHISSEIVDPEFARYVTAKELGQAQEGNYIAGKNAPQLQAAAEKGLGSLQGKDITAYVNSRMRANAFAKLAGIENMNRTAGGQAAQNMQYGPQGDMQSDAFGLNYERDMTHPGVISPQDLYGAQFAAALGRRNNSPSSYKQASPANIKAMQRQGLVPQGPGPGLPGGLFSMLAHLGNRAQPPQAAPTSFRNAFHF